MIEPMPGASAPTILIALAVQTASVATTKADSLVTLVWIVKSMRELGCEPFLGEPEFLKELCITKRANKLKGHKIVSMSEVVSAVVQKNMPLKQKDPGAFTILCVIGNASFKKALCDLGASISVMPKHVYDSLSLKPLNKTSIVIQLVDRSFVYPLGVIEDVLVKIDRLVIPCDFYILDMERDSYDSLNNTPILFGRPFLKAINTKINCGKDTLSLEVGFEKIEFNFHDAMRYPYNNVYSIT